MFRRRTLFSILSILFLAGCIDLYTPNVPGSKVRLLVVDGFINASDSTAKVKLSQASALADPNPPAPERAAMVSIQSNDGKVYFMTEHDSGNYTVSGIEIGEHIQYTLNILTINKETFVSDPIELKSTPAIDTITWSTDPEGVDILLNTHDATGEAKYYVWDYTETWRFNAPLASNFKLVGRMPVYRAASENIYTCFRTEASTKITIGTSVGLGQDLISGAIITRLSKGTEKLSVKYSIVVRQRALDVKEYDYLNLLRKTNENLGNLFAPLPSQVTGNLHNVTNPTTPVLGYFSGGTVHEKRIFIDSYDLPDDLHTRHPNFGCAYDTICVKKDPAKPPHPHCNIDLDGLTGTELIGDAIVERMVIIGYTATTAKCADCRASGGQLVPPVFWR